VVLFPNELLDVLNERVNHGSNLVPVVKGLNSDSVRRYRRIELSIYMIVMSSF
jgi:hypothetical protein